MLGAKHISNIECNKACLTPFMIGFLRYFCLGRIAIKVTAAKHVISTGGGGNGAHAHTHAHIHTHTGTHTHTRAHTHTYTHTYPPPTHTHTHKGVKMSAKSHPRMYTSSTHIGVHTTHPCPYHSDSHCDHETILRPPKRYRGGGGGGWVWREG